MKVLPLAAAVVVAGWLPSVCVPPAAAQQAEQAAGAQRDLPWTPSDTGTVRPGMTRDQVVAVWGQPITERTTGRWTFMYFRNGCEYSCGTHDVVFLQDSQVVDAIVRGRGHSYAGMSSSPAGRVPEFTPKQPNRIP